MNWLRPPVFPVAAVGEVHLWRADLDTAFAQGRSPDSLLTPDERRRAKRFLIEQEGLRFAAGRAILRSILGRYLSMEPSRVPLSYGPEGKPLLAGGAGGLQFNLAHSRRLALYAVTRERLVGVDVEFLQPDRQWVPLARRFFEPGEQTALFGLTAERQLAGFYSCWTRKEAYLKARGGGVPRGMTQFAVSLGPKEQPRLVTCVEGAAEAARWSFCHLVPAVDFIGALAVEGPDWLLRCWQWSWSVPSGSTSF